MLGDLLRGQETSQCILITDTSGSSGRSLLFNWAECLADRVDKVILVCFERRPQFFKNWFKHEYHDKIIFIDGAELQYSSSARCDDLAKLVTPHLSHVKGQAAVVIDSLSLHVLLQHTPGVCQALHRIATDKRVTQVVSVLHRDVHDPQTCSLLAHTASSTVTLQGHNMAASATRHCRVCHVTHCRGSGKVFKTTESFQEDESFRIHDIKPYHASQVIDTEGSGPTEVDEINKMSFNLTLTDTEKIARSQVVLPYTNSGSGDASLQLQQGRIHYSPDDADDLDEEDPDDDLNI